MRTLAERNARELLRFAVDLDRTAFVEGVEDAASFHDLGKLDQQIQAAFRRGRGGKPEWDHIDAGVAHVSAKGNMLAAWLIRAHHSPGLPESKLHFNKDDAGAKLRGRRRDGEVPDEAQVERTEKYLPSYLSEHEKVLGIPDVKAAKAARGLTLRLALSCLVDADHTDTATFDSKREPLAPLEARWDERLRSPDRYVNQLGADQDSDRNRHRRQFYDACRDSDVNSPVVACEGPVGLGKTTAVTAYLLKQAMQHELRRIIVIAPYTNIITQTAETLRKALTLDGENPEEVVVEHHHRVDFDGREHRDLAVLWRAPVIVTTAVQFFETLAACAPGPLRKLHRIPGSGIFLDEAHAALPARLWPQNWKWLRELADRWSCRIVLASGSLVRFWENPDIVTPPISFTELMPSSLGVNANHAERRRVRYRSGGHHGLASLTRMIAASEGPRLVILNTVQSAAIVAKELRTSGQDVLHLSTALSPRDRDSVLGTVKSRLTSRKEDRVSDWTLVATSCVEAGVDISFRTGFRESFSTASLIQVGGRVNRHGEFTGIGGSVVHDFSLEAADGITDHPAAGGSRSILKRLLETGVLESDRSAADIVTRAIAEEINAMGGLGHDALAKAERAGDYPGVARAARIIDADTLLVVVDKPTADRIRRREHVTSRELLQASVQIWRSKAMDLGLDRLRDSSELFAWPHRYEPDFLGYMAGVLELTEFRNRGGAII
ncbi:CRISPR-associated helicase/endonuclease Cas3 [Skermanella pratensis]|uniref:CRISPR-associated helicase/endonuclease Cas3 n=1 Tax=Skermanella pratensis TaxID=2233999 RepID=UPI001787AE46|nr:DEAD/DEAH box helicase [Skermanella pratensis]